MLYAVATYFNPCKFATKRINYLRFRKKSLEQGLPLVVVELSFDGTYEIAETDAEIVLRRSSGDKVFQKEAMFNSALKELPSDCDKVVLIDADILFDDPFWVQKTSDMLDRCNMVQPFSKAVWQNVMGDAGRQRDSWAKVLFEFGPQYLSKNTYMGHPGHAMAFRREVLNQCQLYPFAILGGGDTCMTQGLFVNFHEEINLEKFGFFWSEHINKWSAGWRKAIDNNIGCLNGYCRHLWHGELVNRMYGRRSALLSHFDPSIHVKLNDEGMVVWTSAATKKMKDIVRDYYAGRKEDQVDEVSVTKPDPSFMKIKLVRKSG